MDVIILAAGKNERLKGIIPPYHKPLLVVNGQSLINQLVITASQFPSVEDIIIVCAPQNAMALDAVLPSLANLRFIVQREGGHVINAVRIGLAATTAKTVVLLCADNVIAPSTWQKPPFKNTAEFDDQALYVHGQIMDSAAAQHFTYHVGGIWREKTSYAGYAPFVFCWLGPLVFNVDNMRAAIRRHVSKHPQDLNSLGRAFNEYAGEVLTIESETIDIGLPENLQ